jgi:hypothetical protein
VLSLPQSLTPRQVWEVLGVDTDAKWDELALKELNDVVERATSCGWTRNPWRPRRHDGKYPKTRIRRLVDGEIKETKESKASRKRHVQCLLRYSDPEVRVRFPPAQIDIGTPSGVPAPSVPQWLDVRAPSGVPVAGVSAAAGVSVAGVPAAVPAAAPPGVPLVVASVAAADAAVVTGLSPCALVDLLQESLMPFVKKMIRVEIQRDRRRRKRKYSTGRSMSGQLEGIPEDGPFPTAGVAAAASDYGSESGDEDDDEDDYEANRSAKRAKRE